MKTPYSYTDLAARLASARSWAGGVTTGDRCALVVGVALNVKPLPHHLTFRGEPSAEENVRNMPFLDKFFLKARDLCETIERAGGVPDFTGTGQDIIEFAKENPGKTPIDGRKGVIYLDNCWLTRREKVSRLLGMTYSKSGDHVDLWDGRLLEIYREKGRDECVRGLIVNAEKIKFWAVG